MGCAHSTKIPIQRELEAIALVREAVAKLNRHSPGSAVSWHACARLALEGLEYPASTIPGRVRVRLQLH